jgi:hypothetical protein
MSANEHSVREHFDNRDPTVKKTYQAILKKARELGPIKEDPKKTSIHLVRKTAFAGIATRRTTLILTIKSDADITSKRIVRREHASRNRWHLEIKLDGPEQVDKEIVGWLERSYELAG